MACQQTDKPHVALAPFPHAARRPPPQQSWSATAPPHPANPKCEAKNNSGSSHIIIHTLATPPSNQLVTSLLLLLLLVGVRTSTD